MAESVAEAIKKNDFNKLKQLRTLEETNNMFSELLCRLCVKKISENNGKSISFHGLSRSLERIADYYKYIIDYLGNKKRIKINEDVADFFKDVSRYIRNCYETFYNFDFNRFEHHNTQRLVLVQKAHKLIGKCSRHEAFIISHLLTVVFITYDLVGPIMRFNFKDFIEEE